MNPRIVLLAILEILSLHEQLHAQEETIRQYKDKVAEQEKTIKEYHRKLHDPDTIKNAFNFWVENGLFPEYYG